MSRMKRYLSGALAVTLCVSMNINPVGTIVSELAQTELVKKFGIIGDNIIYILSNIDKVEATDGASTMPPIHNDVHVSIDVDGIISAVNGAKDSIQAADKNNTAAVGGAAENIVKGIDTTNKVITDNGSAIVASVDRVNSSIKKYGEMLNDTIIKKADEIMANDDENTDRIITTIENMQHEYKVAYLYSINNMNNQVMWRPTLNDVPPIEAIPIATTGYAAVYSGFWDAGIDNINNNGANQESFGIQMIQKASNDTRRALEILGYDAIVRAEGYYGSVDYKSGTYVNILMDEGDITWGDAVQILYKALGQEMYSYSYFTTAHDIKPENSPLAQNLSNITTFDTSEGAYYLFVSRSDRLVGNDLTKLEAVYWDRAQNDGLVYKDNYDKPIIWKDLITLAANMMELYGEPVITTEERNALLQVYGLEYPIQLGERLAEDWSYLKARGVLNEVITSYTDAVSRDELLDLGMRIKDEDSRLDYKKIQLTMNLEDAMIADGFYPAKNVKYSTDGFSAETQIDYKGVGYYDYFILASSEQISTFTDENGDHPISPSFVTKSGKQTNAISVLDASTGEPIKDSKYVGIIKDNDGNTYYHVRVSKDFKNTIRIDSNNPNDYPAYIDIDPANAGGGIYTGFSLDTYTSKKGNDTSTDLKGLMVSKLGYKKFSEMKDTNFWIKFIDWLRAEKTDPSELALAPNPTVKEYLSFTWNKWTTPMEVMAADLEYEGNNYVLTLNNTDKGKDETRDIGAANSIARLLCSTNTILSSVEWKKRVEECKDAEEFKKILEGIKVYVESGFDSTKLDKQLKLDKLISEDIGGYTNEKIGTALLHLLAGVPTKYNGLESIDGNGLEFGYTTDFTSMETAIKLHENNIYESVNKTCDYLIAQSDCIYKLLKVCKIKGITIKYSASVTNDGAEQVPTLKSNVVFYINCDESKEVSDILGQITNLTEDGEPIVTSNADTTESTTIDSNLKINNEFSYSVASSTIMNSMNKENILISWDDLISCGVVVDTFKGQQPLPNKTDGVYYLQSVQGQIKVNPVSYSILIGTTYYNLRSSDNTGPRLVYMDSDGKVYFDYRCIMGIATQGIIKTDKGVTESEESIGTGTSVIYTLSGTGVSSPVMQTVNVSSFNWPNVPDDHNTEPSKFTSVAIKATEYDSGQFMPLGSTTPITYWGGNNDDRLRIALASFVPTANWLTVIKMDSAKGSVNAGLFVWYPRMAFVDGKSKYNLTNTEENEKYFSELESHNYDDVRTNVLGENCLTDDEGDYGIKNKDNWWNAMTYYSYNKLYELTGNVPVINKNWVIRYFDLTDNSPIQANEANGTKLTGNDEGSVYWLDHIGFVYNLPKQTTFDIGAYLRGEIPIPAMLYNSQSIGYTSIMYINPDYYPSLDGYSGYGYAIGSKGIYDVNSINNGTLGLVKDLSGNEFGSYNLNLDYTEMQYAPVAIYSTFGGKPLENDGPNVIYNIYSSDLNEYTLNSNDILLGNMRLYYCEPVKPSSDKQFYRGCKYINPIELTTAYAKSKDGSNLTMKNVSFYKVYSSTVSETYVALDVPLVPVVSQDITEVDISSLQTTDIKSLLDKLSLTYLLNRLDDISSWVILCTFYICPIIGWILVTILVGLSFLTSNKVVQKICNDFIDPIKLLTFGNRDVNNLTWKNSIIPCTVCYVALALILNGNIIKLTAWIIKTVQLMKEAVFQFL